jgi:NAD(P)-dependent dehydrogenase (short-subunit alcohol dehydrogenase family)
MKFAAGWIAGSAVLAGAAALALRRNGGMNLRNKVVLITGGSHGLGLAMAREFISSGARLALCARDEKSLAAAADDLKRRGGEVLTLSCDAGERAAIERVVKQTASHYGGLDVVVNNAGIIQAAPAEAVTIEDFQQAMDVMFWGAVYTSMAALPFLRARSEARIVNITSVGGKVAVPHLLPYSCAKFASVAFSEGLRAELSGTGIKVVTIVPGLMRTGSHLNARFKGNAEAEAAWFSTAASLPGISISAVRAARQIVSATRSGTAEKTLGAAANLIARFHGLFPGLAADLMGAVNRVLPGPGTGNKTGAESEILRKPWMRALTVLGEHAAREFLQPAAIRRRESKVA